MSPKTKEWLIYYVLFETTKQHKIWIWLKHTIKTMNKKKKKKKLFQKGS